MNEAFLFIHLLNILASALPAVYEWDCSMEFRIDGWVVRFK